MATEVVTPSEPSPQPTSGYTTVKAPNGLEISSNVETKEQMEESLKPSEAAQVLGKLGGAASAAKRKAQTEEPAEPEREPVEAKARPREENPRHSPSARVREATREAREAREEAARYREELERLRSQPPDARPPEPQKDEAPKPEDFATYEEFVDARAEYRARGIAEKLYEERERGAELNRQAAAYAESIDRTVAASAETFHKFTEETPLSEERHAELGEFLGVLEPSFTRPRGAPIEVTHLVADEILRSAEKGPALALYFLDHPGELARIDAISDLLDAKAEIRSIARGLGNAAPTATAPKLEVSRAPKPVRPVTGALPAAEPVEESGNLDFNEFMRRRKANAARR